VARDAIERALTEGAVDRILAAVGEQYVLPELDREALRGDIESAASVHHTGEVLRVRPHGREEEAKRVWTALQRGEDLAFEYIAHHEALHLHRHIPALKNMIHAFKTDNEQRPHLHKVVSFKQQIPVSPFENLIGNLMRIFKTYFERDAGYSTPPGGGQPGGPFIRFAEAVLREVGLLYEIKSIASAVDKLRRVNPVK
jgi:hypothetical protein